MLPYGHKDIFEVKSEWENKAKKAKNIEYINRCM
jgi:hypothetical protein